ncbi:hypothetical protein [Streptomyces sp. NPDC127092]|uniref:hypothetical protein n=1 Tax=Streptomyces sp. NPDC127092 TaxID=3347135 RepID=UPI00366179A9
MRRLLTAAAAVAAVAATALPAPAAQAHVSHRASGSVTFWSEPNQQGSAWTYTPPGYYETGSPVQRHAYSFESNADVSVYAISYQGNGSCLYRQIHPGDWDNNWTSWATKFDGVSDTTMDCEPA